jgi:hypothetical protein
MGLFNNLPAIHFQSLQERNAMQTIAFYNLKGGVGKTSTAVNIAWHAARWKHRTLLWDLDPQGAASFYLGVDDGDGYKAGNLIKGKQPIGRLKRETRWSNLDAIPADLSMRNADIKLIENGGAKNRLKQLIAPLGESYELVILDCPPTLSPMAESIFAAVDYLFVPVIPAGSRLAGQQKLQEPNRSAVFQHGGSPPGSTRGNAGEAPQGNERRAKNLDSLFHSRGADGRPQSPSRRVCPLHPKRPSFSRHVVRDCRKIEIIVSLGGGGFS